MRGNPALNDDNGDLGNDHHHCRRWRPLRARPAVHVDDLDLDDQDPYLSW